AAPAAPAPVRAIARLADDFTPAHRFEQSFDVPFEPDVVFALFADIPAVAACLPGAVVDAMPAPDRVEGGMRVALGPIHATFRGTARLTRDASARAGTIRGAGADGGSSTEGEISYRVLPGMAPGTARVALEVGYTLKGPLAQFGRPGLVREVAGRLVSAFAANLAARLSGTPAPAHATPGLNPLRLALDLIAARLAALFGRGG
ncbi:SRPBCC family protein, partial [Xanthobacter autotrophicus DSM 431]|uniref:SRPBCC family protein n=1 Tax=Xanthobacter nonsaccharivorans TaxID=3119912 RepID=UPI00372B8CB2